MRFAEACEIKLHFDKCILIVAIFPTLELDVILTQETIQNLKD